MNSFGADMTEISLAVLGTVAGILILSGWIQQIIKGYRTKSLKDISIYLTVFISAGAILWLVYGMIVYDIFIIGTNIAAIVLMMTVLTMKTKYDRLAQENIPAKNGVILENGEYKY